MTEFEHKETVLFALTKIFAFFLHSYSFFFVKISETFERRRTFVIRMPWFVRVRILGTRKIRLREVKYSIIVKN